MTIQAWFVLILTLVAAVLLLTERLRADLVGLIIMVILGLSGVISPQQTFSGFSGPAVMTLLGISIISAGLHRTGVASWLGRWMHRISGKSEWRSTLSVSLVGAVLSLFMNNIAAVGVLLPAVTSLARRARLSPGRLLIPLAYGVTLGGMATLLTTSNIIVSDALQAGGWRSFGLLDFMPVGGPVALAGVLFLVTIGRRLLPRTAAGEKDQPLKDRLGGLYRLGEYTSRIEVLPESMLDGHSLVDIDLAKKTGLNIVGLVREGRTHLAPEGDLVIYRRDVLLAQGEVDDEKLANCGLKAVEAGTDELSLADEITTLAEVVISPHARLIGQTLKGLNFRERYRLNVVAIWRGGKPILSGLSRLRLQFGDALLVQGSAASLQLLREENDLVLLEEDPDAVIAPGKMTVAVAITFLSLLVAALGILPVAVVVMAGAVLLILSGCLQMADIYRTVEWKAIFLIAGMWPLSIALRTTGLAQGVVTGLLSLTGREQPLVLALGLIMVAMLLAQFMSGQVAVLVVAPLALAVAQSSGLDGRALGMAVALGCSLCFPTPTGHPVNIMVLSLGGYRFRDYLRVGLPLTILSLVLILVGLRVFWGL